MNKKRVKNPWMGHEGYNCFGCAPDNEFGVKMEFYEEGDKIVSRWKPQPQFQGWINTLHGGIQAVLLDEIAGWTVFRKLQVAGVTSKMETRYLRPVKTTDEYITLEARITGMLRNLASIEACIYNREGELCTKAICTYYTFSEEKSREEMNFYSCELEEDS